MLPTFSGDHCDHFRFSALQFFSFSRLAACAAFSIERTYDQPITFANLLNHTHGFDVMHIGVAARHPEDVMHWNLLGFNV